MKDNTLYRISKKIINSILMNGFDCTDAIEISKDGLKYEKEIDMHVMEFIINDEYFESGTYISILTGSYISCINKFFPFNITTMSTNNKNNFLQIDIQKLITCMADMDDKYNNDMTLRLMDKIGVNNILQYEFIIGAKDYITISLNELNLDGVLLYALKEGIDCTKSKINKVYKNNAIYLSEDKDTEKLIMELVINDIYRFVVFESVDVHEFYTYLESEALKLLFTDEKIALLSKKYKNKNVKQERKKRIENAVNELLEIEMYRLEEETIKIQTEELLLASDILFEQYEYMYAVLNELNKLFNENSDLIKVVELISSGLESKFNCIDFLSKKTYFYKPRNHMIILMDNLSKQDKIYEGIDDDIKAHVKSKFLYELDLFQYNVVQPQIVQQSKIFNKEIEELNLMIDETQELYELVKSNNIEKHEALKQIDVKKREIEKVNGIKLRSTYKKLHKFAIHLGFDPVRQKGTSHLTYKRNSISVVIPNKRGDIKPGLLLAIVKQLGSNRDEFCEFEI